MIFNTALVPLATAPTVTRATQNYVTPRKKMIKVLQVLSGWECVQWETGRWKRTQPSSIRSHKFRHRPAGVDDGFLFQLAPSMRRNSGKEQRKQSLGSPTCLPPLLPPTLHPPTPSGNQNREKFLQRGFFPFLHVLDSPATSGSQPDLASNAKARPVFPFLIAAVSRRHCRRWYNALESFFSFGRELERTDAEVPSPFLCVE